MQKAKEWAVKFQGVPVVDGQSLKEKYAGLLKEYGEETAKLLAERTKTSTIESKLSVADAVIRQQLDKFRSICGKVKELNETLFSFVVEKYVEDFQKIKDETEKDKKEKEKAGNGKRKPEDDVAAYRSRRRF